MISKADLQRRTPAARQRLCQEERLAEAKAEPAEAPRKTPESPADRVNLTRKGDAYTQWKNRHAQLAQCLKAGAQAGDSLAKAIEAENKKMKVQSKCQKIAARIRRGDFVPPEDRSYLLNHDGMSYKLAMAMRMPKKHPKRWRSVLKSGDKIYDPTADVDPSQKPRSPGTLLTNTSKK